MNIIASLKKLITVNRYYQMNNKELELEASKYKIGGYFDGGRIDRERIIQQLLKKDSENLSRFSIALSLVAILISSLGLFHGLNANKLSKQANILVASGNNLQANTLNFSKDLRSQEYVEDVFNDLYQSSNNLETIQKIRADKFVDDGSNFLYVVDNLESTGNSFCQGTVWKWHLNTTLKNTLNEVCENQQIYDEFAGKKNGLAMLCTEFFPKSKFAQSLQIYNLNTCVFHDSSELQKIIEINY
ncbi:hypothetical protein KKI22_03325 [Patescibacteria group bacterium]|nr:hypothetical protein [Patescibacteria group bacterium]